MSRSLERHRTGRRRCSRPGPTAPDGRRWWRITRLKVKSADGLAARLVQVRTAVGAGQRSPDFIPEGWELGSCMLMLALLKAQHLGSGSAEGGLEQRPRRPQSDPGEGW